MFLSKLDVVTLTGRIRKKAQCKVLDKRGIPYTLDANNSPIVPINYYRPIEYKSHEPKKPKLNLPPLNHG